MRPKSHIFLNPLHFCNNVYVNVRALKDVRKNLSAVAILFVTFACYALRIMSTFYVQESMGKDERLVRFAHFHWFYTLQACLMIAWGVFGALAVLIGAVMAYKQFGWCSVDSGTFGCIHYLHWTVKLGIMIVFIMGLWSFLGMIVVKISTEIAVTTKRLVYKRGLVSRSVVEINIDRIEGVTVHQGILGRIFGYGRVIVRGMGVGEIVLPVIEDPVVFRRAIQWARNYQQDEDKKDDLNV